MSATQLMGSAQTTIRSQEVDLAIPNVPSVANVSDNHTLALTYTANAPGAGVRAMP